MEKVNKFIAMKDNFLKFALSPAGIAMFEHGLVTVLMMLNYIILLRYFGLDVIGLWLILSAVINYSYVGDIWSKGLLSFMGEARGSGKAEDAATFASTAIVTGAIGFLILMSITGAVIYFCADFFMTSDQLQTVENNVFLMVAAFWLMASSNGYHQAFIGFGLPWLSAIQRVGGTLIFLISIIVLPLNYNLEAILKVQFIQGLSMVTFGTLVYFGWLTKGMKYHLWSKRKLKQLFNFGAKLLVIGAVQSSLEPMIKFMVSFFFGLPTVAILELALRFVQGIRGLILSIGQVVVTYFASTSASSEQDDAKVSQISKNFFDTTALIVIGSNAAFTILFIVAPLISAIFLGAGTEKETTGIFTIFLMIFGLAWLINTYATSGYYLLVSLRHSKPLFYYETLRSVLVGVLGFLSGLLGGNFGFLIAVLCAFIIASIYLLNLSSKTIDLSLAQVIKIIIDQTSSTFIPLCFSLGIIIAWKYNNLIWINYGYNVVYFNAVYFVIGPLISIALLVKFGQLNHFVSIIKTLKP